LLFNYATYNVLETLNNKKPFFSKPPTFTIPPFLLPSCDALTRSPPFPYQQQQQQFFSKTDPSDFDDLFSFFSNGFGFG